MRVKTVMVSAIMLACIGAIALSDGREHYDYYWNHPCADDPEGTQTCDSGQMEDSETCWCQGEWDNEDHWISNPDGYPSEPDESAMIDHSNTGYCDGGLDDGDPCSSSADCSGTCSGGQYHGEPCTDDWDCAGVCAGQGCSMQGWACRDAGDCLGVCTCEDAGTCGSRGTCENYEAYLKIDLATETGGYLIIRSADTHATTDSLEVWFNNLGVCNNGQPCEGSWQCLGGTCQKSTKVLTLGVLSIDAGNGPVTLKVTGGTLETDSSD